MKKLIKIGGEDRPVLFNKNALVDIEKITGRPFLRIDWNSYEASRAAVYAGLKWGLYDPEKGVEPKPSFTLFTVGDWLDDNFVGVISQFEENLMDSLPKSKNVEAGESPAK